MDQKAQDLSSSGPLNLGVRADPPQIYAVEIAAKEDRGFVSSFTLMTGNVFGLIASCIICE